MYFKLKKIFVKFYIFYICYNYDLLLCLASGKLKSIKHAPLTLSMISCTRLLRGESKKKTINILILTSNFKSFTWAA